MQTGAHGLATAATAAEPVPALGDSGKAGPRQRAAPAVQRSAHSGRRRELTKVIAGLGYAASEQLESIAAAAAKLGRRPEDLLVKRDIVSADQLAGARAERLGLEHLDLSAQEIDLSAAHLLSLETAKRYSMVPVRRIDDATLLVAMADPGTSSRSTTSPCRPA
jgi:type IV pilus assembly protein PilB